MAKIKLPLQQYNQTQKLDLLETLWNDLTQHKQKYKSPDWHQPILKERKEIMQNGKEELLDWSDELKTEIKKESLC